MTFCPICERPAPAAALVRLPYVYGQTLELTLKIKPDWKRENGMIRDEAGGWEADMRWPSKSTKSRQRSL